MSAASWRFLGESVRGTSHARTGQPCQDAHLVTPFAAGGRSFLIVACADGAGSATHSDRGAQIACAAAVDAIVRQLESSASLDAIDRATAGGWLAAARACIAEEARTLGVEPRQLACTLLVAIVADDAAIFVQLGDGAIVVRDEREATSYRPIFWPQNGEYANATYFITDDAADGRFLFERVAAAPEVLAVFTDGLQPLVLNYATRTAFAPFFEPLFRTLAGAASSDDLAVPFRALLASESVSARTDDDKTLVVAMRVETRDAGDGE